MTAKAELETQNTSFFYHSKRVTSRKHPPAPTSIQSRRASFLMALRHPWFSQPLKRKHPDDFVSDASGGCGGGGFGVVGTVYGDLGANAYGVGQTSPPNQGSNSNGRATKRFRSFESRNLERGFAELSIQPAPVVASPLNIHHHHQHQLQQQPDTQEGGDGMWSNVVGNVGQSSSVVCSDGSILPLLRSSSVDEPPSPEVDDVQMSIPTWYEPEKDSEFLHSLPHSLDRVDF